MMRITSSVPTSPAVMPSRIESRAERRADLALLDDLERHRQRAGLERQRQVLRLLQRPAAQRDLAVPVDPALDDRRAALDPAVEHDGHVVADVPAGLRAELAAACAVELEGDDRPVGQLVDLGGGVLEVARRSTIGLSVQGVEQRYCCDADARSGPPTQRARAARQQPLDLRELEQQSTRG